MVMAASGIINCHPEATLAIVRRMMRYYTWVRRLEYVKLCVRLKRAMGSQP